MSNTQGKPAVDYGKMTASERLAFCRGAEHRQDDPVAVVTSSSWNSETGNQCTIEPILPTVLESGTKLYTRPAQGEPVYQLRNTVVGNVWREVDKEAYDSAAKLVEYERRLLYTHADPAEVERLRAQIAKLQAGLYQQIVDKDLKKIADYVSNPDLPKGAFLRQDAYDLANMCMHMVREVQASRIKLAERDALLAKARFVMNEATYDEGAMSAAQFESECAALVAAIDALTASPRPEMKS